MATQMMLRCVFSGNQLIDPQLAASRLRRAGCVVYELPQRYRALLHHPRDDFLEVVVDAPEDAAAIAGLADWIGRQIERYGGFIEGYGPASAFATAGQPYVPFRDLFAAATEEQIEEANRRAVQRSRT
jgi:hypothetical protein